MKVVLSFLLLIAIACSTHLTSDAPRNPASELVDAPFEVKLDVPHKVQVIESGLAALEKRLEMIDRAEVSIDAEYFIYNLDLTGRIFTQALIKKKQKDPQVKIRLMVDASSTVLKLSPEYVAEMTHAGIEVKAYNPVKFWQIVSAQYRDHRKLFLIDGREAITGGRNIADEYFDLNETFNFRDRDLWVQGPVVAYMEKAFNEYWNSKHAKYFAPFEAPDRSSFRDIPGSKGVDPVSGETQYRRALAKYESKHAPAVEFVTETENDHFVRREIARLGQAALKDPMSKGECASIQSVTDEAGFTFGLNKFAKNRRVREALEARVFAAQDQHIYVESPYFIVEHKGQKAIRESHEHNNKITLLTNGLSSTDAFYVAANFIPRVALYAAEGAGEIYTYSAQAPRDVAYAKNVKGEEIAKNAVWGLHAKTMVFGTDSFSIGTFNIDPRSANLNAEMVLICEGNEKLTSYVRDKIVNRIEQSNLVDPKNPKAFRDAGLKKSLLFTFSIPASTLAEFLL